MKKMEYMNHSIPLCVEQHKLKNIPKEIITIKFGGCGLSIAIYATIIHAPIKLAHCPYA